MKLLDLQIAQNEISKQRRCDKRNVYPVITDTCGLNRQSEVATVSAVPSASLLDKPLQQIVHKLRPIHCVQYKIVISPKLYRKIKTASPPGHIERDIYAAVTKSTRSSCHFSTLGIQPDFLKSTGCRRLRFGSRERGWSSCKIGTPIESNLTSRPT